MIFSNAGPVVESPGIAPSASSSESVSGDTRQSLISVVCGIHTSYDRTSVCSPHDFIALIT